VALVDITQESVRRALDQFHQLGRDAFLERYGFGKARGYFVLDRGVPCDSKAIVGAAHGFLEGMSPQRVVASNNGTFEKPIIDRPNEDCARCGSDHPPSVPYQKRRL
jgi:hypothetical protein